MEVLLVIAGGLLAIGGGVVTALVQNRLQFSQARREELLESYSRWAATYQSVVDSSDELKFFDFVEEDKKRRPTSTIPSSPAGHTREELVRAFRDSRTALATAESRLLLLEGENTYRNEIEELSERVLIIPGPEADKNPLQTLMTRKKELREFLRKIQGSHPLLRQ